MDFIIGLPKKVKQHSSIMVMVDKLSREAHFILVKYAYKAIKITNIFRKDIFRLHGVLKIIILDRNAKFMGKFWKALFKGLCIQLNFSIAYHPQMNGKMKRVNNVFKDMLRMYAMDKLGMEGLLAFGIICM